MLTATKSGNNIILKSSRTAYELERKLNTGAWEPWNGTSWGGAPVTINTENFTDYDLSDGVYQYRTIIGAVIEYSSCVSIGSDFIGWTFGNYIVPEGQFGEILTADDMHYSFMFGIDLVASNGQVWTDKQTQILVSWSVYQLEKALNIDIFPRAYYSDDDENSDVEESKFVIKEFPYPNRRARKFDIRLRHRPVREVTRFDFYSPVDTKVIDLTQWMRVDRRNGNINFKPKQGVARTYTSYGWPWNHILSYVNYRDAFHLNYTTGYETAELIPEDLREIIGKMAAVKALNVIGDGLLAGFSSSSISLDGLTESFSSTQGVENSFFGARINVYTKEIEAYIQENRNKYGNFRIGSI